MAGRASRTEHSCADQLCSDDFYLLNVRVLWQPDASQDAVVLGCPEGFPLAMVPL